MGDIQENTGFARFREGGVWYIGAWSSKTGYHKYFKFGVRNATTIAAYKTATGKAANDGLAAWLSYCGTAFTSWFNGLTTADQDGIFDAAQASNGMEP